MQAAVRCFATFWVKENDGVARIAEPITVGVPIPDGCDNEGMWAVTDESGRTHECQCEVLTSWRSGSPKWLLVTMLVDLQANGEQQFQLIQVDRVATTASAPDAWGSLAIGNGPQTLFSTHSQGKQHTAKITVGLDVVSGKAGRYLVTLSASRLTASGPVSESVLIDGELGKRRPLHFSAQVTQFHHAPLLKIELTLHNPRRAEHPDGFWDLGDSQSELLHSVVLSVGTSLPESRTVQWAEQPGQSMRQTDAQHWTLRQESSGGTNWHSRVHCDAHGRVPWKMCGYEVAYDTIRSSGNRASPVVGLSCSDSGIVAGVRDFWQEFPSAIEVDGSTLRIHLLPRMPDFLHELQAGEKTTRVVWIRLTDGPIRPSDLDWIYRPLTAAPTTECVSTSGGLEWHSDGQNGSGSPGDQLTTEMLAGPRNFFWKREAIDEYGWRNFGDFWADHEEAYAEEPRPIISHYNNQYDLLHGLLRQFLTTGDHRWWQLAAPLARHVLDIDIYHTTKDRAAYNGGLFWHTSHYLDAGTCTHRSYSRQMIGKKYPIHGGGPSNEHNYSSGLLLYYYLTGDPRTRAAVLSLADWVIAMDDGRQHVLAPLSSAPTGNASSTSSTTYHGPGRGAGNSINALVDAWQLTHQQRYLDKCRELIRRVVHPQEDVAVLDLGNAEARWSYTVCLQALARYDAIVGGADPDTCRYVRASLVQYGRWMVQHERLYLDEPEQLEFPTETWPAQDLRKGTTLLLIARYLQGDQRAAMAARGEELLQGAWKQLLALSTRTFTRPAAIVLQQLPIERYLRSVACQDSSDTQVAEWEQASWPARTQFHTQKTQIKAGLRSPTGLCRLLLSALRPRPWIRAIPQTPLGTRFRRAFSR